MTQVTRPIEGNHDEADRSGYAADPDAKVLLSVREPEDHPHQRLNPTYDPRGCAYEHIHVLMEHLRRLGHDPAIDVPDDAFGELERVES